MNSGSNNQVDWIIKNATVIDGSGNDKYLADIAIKHDLIVGIGQLNDLTAKKTINASGLCIAPGFIDVHTHDDTQVIKNPAMLAKLSQGVTTVIVGNCGISASPVTLTSAPPDPMNLLGTQDDFRYPEFITYARAVEQSKPAVNVAALIGHTSLRNNVMSSLDRAATDAEIALMCKTLNIALEQGAIGLSSGLAYATAIQSSETEVNALARTLAEFDCVYTTHLRTEFDLIHEAMEEAFTVGSDNNVSVVISHLKCAGVNNWGRSQELISAIEHANTSQEVACDCYPYAASASTLDMNQITSDFDINITWSDPHPECANQLLADIADKWQLSLTQAAEKLMPAGAVYHCMFEGDVENILKYDKSMIGSDGLPEDPHPHPRLWGTFPRVLGHYSRELNLFSLEQAVHKMTALSAKQFKLKQRGKIQEGYYADLVMFNPETVIDKANYKTPTAMSSGILAVWVNGCLSFHRESASVKRAGKFLYHHKKRY